LTGTSRAYPLGLRQKTCANGKTTSYRYAQTCGIGGIKDKSLMSKIQMIDQLPDEEKDTVLKVIDMALTKMKMKDFFQQQLAH
jgi:hypothetical protein